MSPPPPPPPPSSSSLSSSSSSSASKIGNNEDLLTEILTHLPTLTLLRLKSVNKQFYSTISHPSFSLLHSLRHPLPPPSALFLLLPSPSPSSPSFSFLPLSSPPLPPPPIPPPPFLLHSSFGLFLSLSPSPSPSPLSPFLVSNPTTRLRTQIFPVSALGRVQIARSGQGQGEVRISGLGEGEVQLVGASLGFDPGRWEHYYVIRVLTQDLNLFFIDVYDSNTRKWRDVILCFDDAPFDTEFDRGVYWKGRVLWLSHTGRMVYYDIESEVIGKLVLPKVFDEGSYLERFRYFGESCGHLHLVEIRTNCVREFDVLELEEREVGDSEWFVKFKVDLDVVGCGFEDDMFQDGVDRFGRRLRFYAFSILAVIRGNGDEGNDDDECSALVLSIPGKVISYNFKSKVSRLLCNMVDETDKWFPFRGYNAFQFIQSLYCP